MTKLEGQIEFERACENARNECKDKILQATHLPQAEYNRLHDMAYIEYDRECEAAYNKYKCVKYVQNEALAKFEHEYESRRDEALTEYEATCEAAYNKYRTKRDHAWNEYKKHE